MMRSRPIQDAPGKRRSTSRKKVKREPIRAKESKRGKKPVLRGRSASRSQTDDSVEVYLGSEFIAVIYKDVDEGETSYQFQMTVLSEDLGD